MNGIRCAWRPVRHVRTARRATLAAHGLRTPSPQVYPAPNAIRKLARTSAGPHVHVYAQDGGGALEYKELSKILNAQRFAPAAKSKVAEVALVAKAASKFTKGLGSSKAGPV